MLSHFFEAKISSRARGHPFENPNILFALKFLPILRSPEDRVGDVGITQTFLMGLSKPIAQLLGIRAVTLHEFIFNRWFSSEVHEQHQHSDLGSSRKWRDHLALVVSLGWRGPRFWILSGRFQCSWSASMYTVSIVSEYPRICGQAGRDDTARWRQSSLMRKKRTRRRRFEWWEWEVEWIQIAFKPKKASDFTGANIASRASALFAGLFKIFKKGLQEVLSRIAWSTSLKTDWDGDHQFDILRIKI